MLVLPTVTASTMITRFELRRKVRCHNGAVEMFGVSEILRGRVGPGHRNNPNGWDV